MTNQEKALTAFIGVIGEATERIDELKEYLDNHCETSPESVNWGHVGNAQHILKTLTELTDWAFKRGEYSTEGGEN